MKMNITKGLILISAIALSSCSTQNKLVSSSKVDDDVYSTTPAVAGDQPVYAEKTSNYRQDNYSSNDDYYNYDSYSARLNRFYDSPFALSYYDNLYYGGLSPYYSGIGLGLSFGYGAGYFGGYSPYGLYNPYYSYSPYSPYGYGSLYGYGEYPYAGVYSYYNAVARPYRGYPTANTSYYPTGTPGTVRGTSVTPQSVNNTPVIQQTRPQPTYQPQAQPQSYPSGNGGGGYSSSGGGGGRPSRH